MISGLHTSFFTCWRSILISASPLYAVSSRSDFTANSNFPSCEYIVSLSPFSFTTYTFASSILPVISCSSLHDRYSHIAAATQTAAARIRKNVFPLFTKTASLAQVQSCCPLTLCKTGCSYSSSDYISRNPSNIRNQSSMMSTFSPRNILLMLRTAHILPHIVHVSSFSGLLSER